MPSSLHHHLPSALARQIARGLPEGARAEASRQDVAERLGQWLNVNEAIRLHAAQPAIAGAATSAGRRAPRALPAALHTTLRAELDRVRAVLTRAISEHTAHPPKPNDLDTAFALAHQRLGDLQRRMEMGVQALREHVRQQLAQSTPAMAQLAATDAVMDGLFSGREQRLLSGLTHFFKARFLALRQQANDGETPDALRWLSTFAAEFEQTLLAELDLRLQPVTGLIEALAHEP